MQRGFGTDVYRIRATGQELEKLTVSSSTVSYLSPTYVPEGDKLAYSEWSPWTSTTFLYVANADGTDPVRLPLSVKRPKCSLVEITPSRSNAGSLAAHGRPVDLIETAAVVAADIGPAADDPDQIVYKS